MEIMTPDRYEISDTMADPDAIFVRATDMHNYEFNPALRCLARAGIGVNSIPSNAAAKPASWCSTPLAATPTPSRNCSCSAWVWPPVI